ncbi:hypothetical protein BDP27DRAFT_1368419 [Rhodocollybia butyracea]|uniref:Uncharacterized protein n=1 Tax=Rhodocollybia butyracea TaxID=206335 RepID=A0A9P5PJ14_9AGAR|nr:hypothetical protein BDP27DRAFT_1368419 [Rhodocollybia butyracea]
MSYDTLEAILTYRHAEERYSDEDEGYIRGQIGTLITRLQKIASSLSDSKSWSRDEREKIIRRALFQSRSIVEEINLILLTMKDDIKFLDREFTHIRVLTFLVKTHAEFHKNIPDDESLETLMKNITTQVVEFIETSQDEPSVPALYVAGLEGTLVNDHTVVTLPMPEDNNGAAMTDSSAAEFPGSYILNTPEAETYAHPIKEGVKNHFANAGFVESAVPPMESPCFRHQTGHNIHTEPEDENAQAGSSSTKDSRSVVSVVHLEARFIATSPPTDNSATDMNAVTPTSAAPPLSDPDSSKLTDDADLSDAVPTSITASMPADIPTTDVNAALVTATSLNDNVTTGTPTLSSVTLSDACTSSTALLNDNPALSTNLATYSSSTSNDQTLPASDAKAAKERVYQPSLTSTTPRGLCAIDWKEMHPTGTHPQFTVYWQQVKDGKVGKTYEAQNKS